MAAQITRRDAPAADPLGQQCFPNFESVIVGSGKRRPHSDARIVVP
jgi:hypothetical protein